MNLRLLTWNVLADCYSPPTCPILWEERKELVRDSLFKTPVDLMLLQEVDHYADYYEKMLLDLGYSSEYVQRPGRKDGLVVGYRPEKLLLCSPIEQIQFDDLAITTRVGGKQHRDPNFERRNVAMICKFRLLNDGGGGQMFTAANTHLYWNPSQPEVKLAQARYLLQRVRKSNPEGHPVVLGGDMNALPGSEVYNMLTSHEDQPLSPLAGEEGETKFLVDYNLSKLARWMRVLGIDCVLETKASHELRCGKQGDFTSIFSQARRENRIILTSSRNMRERASCPQSMMIRTVSLEQELTRICEEYSINISESRFLTVCGKCGGSIEGVEPDDARLEGKFVPTDRPVFCCTTCTQPYWWNSRENSSPARAMRVAERLHKIIAGDDSWRGEGAAAAAIASGQEEVVFRGDASALGTELTSPHSQAEQDGESVKVAGESESQQAQALSALFAKRNATIAERTDAKKAATLSPASSGDVASSQAPPSTTDEDAVTTIAPTSTSSSTSTSTSTTVTPLPLLTGLRSAVSLYSGCEPAFTNLNGDFRGTLDYLFVSKELQVVEAAVAPESLLKAAAPGPIPSAVWPSDHLAVVATVTFENRVDGE